MVERYCFLFDECLSLDLVAVANSLGHWGYHVNYLGRAGESDAAIAIYAQDHDMVVVTNNRVDFLRVFKRFELHCGLVIIVPNSAPPEQERLFALAVERIASEPDMINKLLEIDQHGTITFTDWPPPLSNTPEI